MSRQKNRYKFCKYCEDPVELGPDEPYYLIKVCAPCIKLFETPTTRTCRLCEKKLPRSRYFFCLTCRSPESMQFDDTYIYANQLSKRRDSEVLSGRIIYDFGK